MALTIAPEIATTRESLERRRDHLHRRLDDGYRRIDEGQAAGRDTGDWERLWISILREYEFVCRQIDARP